VIFVILWSQEYRWHRGLFSNVPPGALLIFRATYFVVLLGISTLA
jgi:hypothetical protein